MAKAGFPTLQMPEQRLYANRRLVAARREFARRHSRSLERYLSALLDAERVIQTDQDQTARILSRVLTLPLASILGQQRKVTFNRSLDESLVLGFDSEARWTIETKHDGNKPRPNFRRLLFKGPLKAVKPGRINVLR